MSEAAETKIVIDNLIKKGIEAYEKKMKEGPPVIHKHTFPEMAQVCLICRNISKPDCMPKIIKPVSPCQARNIVLNLIKARSSYYN